MKKIILFLGTLFICLPLLSGITQQLKEKTETEKAEQKKQAAQVKVITYESSGRRDPFKDLLGGIDSTEVDKVEGITQIAIDDIVLSGIIKVRGKLTAIISDPQGFALYIKKGDKLLDGYVLSIEPTLVIFRKTKQRGMPLFKPKKIIKRLFDEER
ncbi:MAG: hypothetical protein KAX11_07610 [Candidatus Aminicenantes bacterium]|nr:hypothetical protein [Candidatus Aminicenantes bacterium]